MSTKSYFILTGLMLILAPILMLTFFTLLQINFEYPDILREPADYVLRQFQAGGPTLIFFWYGLMLSAVLMIPLTIMIHKVLSFENHPYLSLATTFGVAASIVQFLGLIRWPFLVPYLATLYLDPTSNPAAREAALVIFQTFNQYAGIGIGEHLGYLFTSLWSVLIGLVMLKSPLFKSWLGWVGIVSALGIFMGVFEPVGFGAAAAINAVSFMVWPVWLIISGVFLLRAKTPNLVLDQR